jgi:hypothetical protein
MGVISAFWVMRVAPPSSQTYHFAVLLKAPSHPLPPHVTHIDNDKVICH